MSGEGEANSGYRPEFVAALQLFARLREAMRQRGLQRPILVGGAAAEFWSLSAVTTGDFDICTTRQPELEEEMERAGLVRPSGAGAMLKGWIHPELRLVRPIRETALFRVICVEDLIADRMDQYASRSAPDRIDQAYLERRIREESMGDYGVEDITR